ncbi:hypothetical protein ACTFIW_001783 [Dictyostelium discoideum]
MSNNNNNNNNDEENSKLDIVKKQFQEKEKQRLQSKLEKREISNKEQIDQSSSNIASETLLLINNLSDDIENRLNEISNNTNENKAEDLKESYNQMEESLSEINSITTMSSHILTSYDVKSILENIDNLRKQIDKSKEKYMPKQKLSLTRKKTKTTTVSTKTTSSKEDTNETYNSNNNNNNNNKNSTEPIFNLINIKGFKNKELFYPPKKEEEIGNQDINNNNNNNNSINDLFISDLTDCTVILDMKVLTALKINNLVNCKIRANSPIDGSIFIDNCINSIFSLVSRQIRIHYCTNCQFNIFVKSNPIIEGSKQIKFSSYLQNLKQQQQEQQEQQEQEKSLSSFDNKRFKEYSFDLESNNIDSDKWKLVNDFDWIQQKQSPNWSLVEY